MTKTGEKNLDDELYYQQLLLKTHKDVAEKYGQYEFCKEWLSLKYTWLSRSRTAFFWDICKLSLRHPILLLRRAFAGRHNLRANRAYARFHNE